MPSSAIDLAAPLGARTFHPLAVREVLPETREAIAVRFDLPSELRQIFTFAPGQYLTFRAQIGGQEVRRSYSICAGSHEGSLRIAIKRVPGGVFSGWAHEHVKPGSILEASPPAGRFGPPLSAENRKHYVAFAAGSGITPVLSILKSTLQGEPRSRFTLFYGNRSSATAMFREELADLKDLHLTRFNLVHVLTREHQDLDLLNGRITPSKAMQLLERLAPLASVDQIFLCGPYDMSLRLAEQLKASGFPTEKIRTERFGAASAVRSSSLEVREKPRETCEVTVISDGRSRVFLMEREKETVLDAALRHGIELRYSCKGGVCSTCRCKLASGKVEMDANYALESYEVERGFVLACQSYPLTPAITVNFDCHD